MKEKLIGSLEAALLNGEIEPYFQPLIDIRTGYLTGFEVLARWHHPTLGIVMPDEFVPLAEQLGMIGMLNRVVMVSAFKAAERFPLQVGLSVNISPEQLCDRMLPTQIRELAAEHNFALKRLMIELTESALIDNISSALPIAQDLKALGVRLALDDFGTGYSSLTYLQALPFDELKIDRSFIKSMTTSRESRKIVAAVVGLGRNLGLCTVAEGIEDQAQADMLQLLGCEIGQGWFYGRPQKAEDLRWNKADFVQNAFNPPVYLETPNSVICLEALPSFRLAQMQAIYDGAPVGLCFLDADFRHVSINARLAEMNGVPLEQHIGKTVQEVVPGIYKQLKPHLERAMRGEVVTGLEIDGPPTSHGEGISYLLSYHPAKDETGEVIGVSVAVVDITERRKHEKALSASEEHFRNMVELSPQMPWTMDEKGNMTDMNSRWQAMTGSTSEQTLGWGWLNFVHPEDVLQVSAVWSSCLKSGMPIDVECRVLRREGGWHWVRSRGASRRCVGSEALRWYGSIEMIDSRKEAERDARRREIRLQAIIDSLPVGVVVAEMPYGRISLRNRKAELLLERKLDFDTFSDYPENVAYYRDGSRLESKDFPLTRAITFGAETDGEVVYCDLGSGCGKWISISSLPVRDESGAIICAVATLREVPAAEGSTPLPSGAADLRVGGSADCSQSLLVQVGVARPSQKHDERRVGHHDL